MKRSKALFVVLFAAFLVMLVVAPVIVAQSTITISMTAPEWMQDTFSDDVFAEFEQQHPGVDVVFVISGDSMYYGSAAFGVEEHLDGVETYAGKADVLYVDSYNLSVDATRAGYFLDLSPLVSSDSSFDSDDFFPAVWESFQWDDGIWALPVSASLNVLIYKPAAFDETGLAYPNESWTIDDFIHAVETLSVMNSRGEVTTPGFLNWGASGLLFRALLGHGFYDDTTFPAEPHFQDSELESILTTWSDAERAGFTGNNFSGTSDDVPMSINGLWSLSNNISSDPADATAAVLLPGGVAGLSVQGFGVSRGTQNPDLAYELVKYLSSNVLVANRFFGDAPARRSLVGVEVDDPNFFVPQIKPEVATLRDEALENALPASELRFSDYINSALNSMNPDGDNLDAFSALQQAENDAITNLQTAAERRETANVFVAGPTPTPVLNAGEVSIKFSIGSNISPLPNREQWEQEVQAFVADDPQVGQIVFEAGFGSPEQYIEDGADCFYVPYNLVASLDPGMVLNLDPFMDADPTFDESDFIGGALTQVRRDNMTWAYPLTVQPEVLWYDTEKFDEAGVPYPEEGWSVEQFNDALQALQIDPEDPPPFSPGYGNTYLLLLAAAYGGVPLDYRTDPPTVNFDDPASVDALRQVLDLAKAGYINYDALADFNGGGYNGQQTIYNEPLSSLSWRLQNQIVDSGGELVDPYQLTTFPRGTQFTGVAYALGTGYISAGSPNPDACYRWLTELANHPDLFTALPARRSAIGAFEESTAYGEQLADVYNEIDTLLQDPNTIPLQTQFGGGSVSLGSWILPVWLNKAMDAYVLEDADLEAELADAQMFADTYSECIADIPIIPSAELAQMGTAESTAYYEQYTDCAVRVDPSLEAMFNFGDADAE
ncbi:MAG: extracellular solute-binding protein [Chloroflexota bacterium]